MRSYNRAQTQSEFLKLVFNIGNDFKLWESNEIKKLNDFNADFKIEQEWLDVNSVFNSDMLDYEKSHSVEEDYSFLRYLHPELS